MYRTTIEWIAGWIVLPFILDTFVSVYLILQALPQKLRVGGSGSHKVVG